MSDARALLGKIRDLRQRLAQVQGLVGEANRTAASLLNGGPEGDIAPDSLVSEGSRRQALLDASVRQLSDESSNNEIRPTRLIDKVRIQLERGRELVSRLKTLADEPLLGEGDPSLGDDDTLLLAYRDTAAMTESTLRLVQAFPDAPTSQVRLGEGLENIVNTVADRVEALVNAIELRKSEFARRDALAGMLQKLHAGEEVDPVDLVALADYLLGEVRQSAPIRFLYAPASKPAAFIAAHSITTARVLARIIRYDPDWQRCIHDAIVAALLKDVGMLSIAPETLTESGELNTEQRRAIESHCRLGAELVAKHLPATATLCESIASHHERLNGSGYPANLHGTQIGPLPRLLAVADVYAAMCCPRPHRPAMDPRTALTEALLLAERGLLDRNLAERLLQLSFYPSGSVVELADGSVGLVVASHMAPREIYTPAKPVVALLADAEGKVFSSPRHIDLAECEGGSIVRALSESQRRLLLGRRYPELV
jgi:HD-GYP domain-containing protein (c-di-GMP phosphodiesterase class II)